jgi:hypothetical protein
MNIVFLYTRPVTVIIFPYDLEIKILISDCDVNAQRLLDHFIPREIEFLC